MESKVDLGAKALQDMVTGSSNGVVNLKIEHPEFQKLKAGLVPARSGKKALEGKLSELEDIMAASSSPANEEKVAWKDANDAKEILKKFIDELRREIPKMEKIEAADVVPNDVKTAENYKSLATAHLDAMKDKIKKLKAVL